MTDADLLLILGVDPATLDPVLEQRDGPDRVGSSPVPCSTCGQPARFTRIVDLDHGPRWLDRCRNCFLATVSLQPHRMPASVDGIVADLRAAMADLADRGQAEPVDRYHLLLTLDGRPAMHGWWSKESTARRQFASWVGERGDMPAVRITLVDTETGEKLAAWPKEP
jgi:hypothetical protein